MTTIPLHTIHQEARADSRDLAVRLDNRHKNVLSLIADYSEDFHALGSLALETEVIQGRGQPAKFVMLNEDQCYLLLTLVRNSEATVPMKRELVQAFSAFRRQAAPLALPSDPIELLELSLAGIRQNRAELAQVGQRTTALEDRLDRTPILMFPEQEAVIYTLCQELGRVMPGGYRAAYRAFKAHFGAAGVPLAKYTSLPTCRYDEARGYLRGLIAQHTGGERLLGDSA